MLRLLLTEIIVSVKMLVGACENGSAIDEDSSEQTATSNKAQTDSLNHRAFKTVSLFKSTGVLSIFELMHHSFTALLG